MFLNEPCLKLLRKICSTKKLHKILFFKRGIFIESLSYINHRVVQPFRRSLVQFKLCQTNKRFYIKNWKSLVKLPLYVNFHSPSVGAAHLERALGRLARERDLPASSDLRHVAALAGDVPVLQQLLVVRADQQQGNRVGVALLYRVAQPQLGVLLKLPRLETRRWKREARASSCIKK